MLIPLFFFVLAGLTLCALIWAIVMLMTDREDPLGARLDQLQAFAVASGGRREVIRSRAGMLNSVIYFISLVPGGEEYLRETEQQLAYGGLRQRWALGAYALFQVLFLLLALGIMADLQRGNDILSMFVGMAAALVLGWLLPKQLLHFPWVRYAYRLPKLQDALPDTVDLLGVVLGTGLALDQALLRVSEEMEFIYPELASEFATVVMQVKAGQERAKAFKALVRRTGIRRYQGALGDDHSERTLSARVSRRRSRFTPIRCAPPPPARRNGCCEGGHQDAFSRSCSSSFPALFVVVLSFRALSPFCIICMKVLVRGSPQFQYPFG